jgi:hypothetical protein
MTKWSQKRSRKMAQPTGIIEFIQKTGLKWRTGDATELK